MVLFFGDFTSGYRYSIIFLDGSPVKACTVFLNLFTVLVGVISLLWNIPLGPSNSATSALVLEVVIHSRALILGHTLLLVVHLHHLPTTRCFIRFLVISDLNKSRKSQTDTLLATGVEPLLHTRLVPRAQRQVRSANLPDIPGLEPDVRLVLATRRVRIEGLRSVDNNLAQLLVQFFEDSLGETGPDVANSLIRVA